MATSPSTGGDSVESEADASGEEAVDDCVGGKGSGGDCDDRGSDAVTPDDDGDAPDWAELLRESIARAVGAAVAAADASVILIDDGELDITKGDDDDDDIFSAKRRRRLPRTWQQSCNTRASAATYRCPTS